MDFHAWQISFWVTGQAAEQQASSPLNPSHSKSGLDIPRQIFTQARRPPCRRSRGAKGLHGPLEEHSDEFLCMDERRFSHSLEVRLLFLMWFQRNSTFGSQVWCSAFPLFLVPYGTKPPHCYPSYCLQPGAVCRNGNVCKTPFTSPKKNLYFSRHWNREAAGPRSNLFKPNCKSQTILLYYYNLSQRSLLFLWKGESKNGEKNALFQAEMTKSFFCMMKKKKDGCQGVNCVWKLRVQKVIKSCCSLLPSPNCSPVIIRADETSDPNAHCL